MKFGIYSKLGMELIDSAWVVIVPGQKCILKKLQVMPVGSIFMVLLLTVLCFLLFSGFFMRSWILCSLSFLFFLWLLAIFMELTFCCVFVVLSGISRFVVLSVLVAFCVVFYFSTYGKKAKS